MDPKRQQLPPEANNLLLEVEQDLGVPGEPGRLANGLASGGMFLVFLGVLTLGQTNHHFGAGRLTGSNALGLALVGIWAVYFGWRLFKTSVEVGRLEARHRFISRRIRELRGEGGR